MRVFRIQNERKGRGLALNLQAHPDGPRLMGEGFRLVGLEFFLGVRGQDIRQRVGAFGVQQPLRLERHGSPLFGQSGTWLSGNRGKGRSRLHHRSGGRFRCRLFDHGLKRLLDDGRRRCGHLRDGRRGRGVGRAHAGGQNEQQRGEKRHVHTEAGMFERQERVHRRCGVRVTGRQTIRNQVCSGTRRCRAERGRGRFHRAITVNTPLGSCRQVIKESI